MEIFLKSLDKLKKSELSEQECKYDKGWNDAIKKVEELIFSYSPADMWIPTEVKLPPEPNKEENPEIGKNIQLQLRGLFYQQVLLI